MVISNHNGPYLESDPFKRCGRAEPQMSNDYRSVIYGKYVSEFKGRDRRTPNYEFGDSKLIPLLSPWIAGIDREKPCVDLGCGDGNILHALQTLGFLHLYGVDVSAEQIDLARRVLPGAVTGQIVDYLKSFPDAHFGLVTLFDVIEHLRKDEIIELLGLISTKLIRGGIFIAHCPNGDSPMVGQAFSGDPTHETLLNATSAEILCRIAGLSDFEASEHLGASHGLRGICRRGGWYFLRFLLRGFTAIETGSAGSRILTRNFAFRAIR